MDGVAGDKQHPRTYVPVLLLKMYIWNPHIHEIGYGGFLPRVIRRIVREDGETPHNGQYGYWTWRRVPGLNWCYFREREVS